MVLGWVSLRRSVSHRSFTAVALLSVLAISLHTLFRQHPLHASDLAGGALDRVDWSAELPPAPLGNHTLTPDGLLVVNPDGPHPIFQLIHDAQADWKAKRARASKTLSQAVAEYKRRYKRAPPLGFDKWYVPPTSDVRICALWPHYAGGTMS